ncbi:MAG: hypothetical protein M1837_000429 [Sclerophora amabilis]|nr:MAG: hypothetical protein M1837_000429 [Sclerophora amabilis]
MSTSSMDRVLSTPELLEKVLIQLPPRDLLVHAQCVSRAFHSLITSSPSLQQALYFRGKPGEAGRAAELNPLLKETFPPWYKDVRALASWYDWARDEDLETMEWNSSDQKRAAYARSDASWRRMLVVQPPVATLKVIRTLHHMRGSDERKAEIRRSDGLRMGTLYDLVEGGNGMYSTSSFSLLWHMFPAADYKRAKGEVAADDDEEDGEDEDAEEEEEDVGDDYAECELENCITIFMNYHASCIPSAWTLGRTLTSHGYEEVELDWEE